MRPAFSCLKQYSNEGRQYKYARSDQSERDEEERQYQQYYRENSRK